MLDFVKDMPNSDSELLHSGIELGLELSKSASSSSSQFKFSHCLVDQELCFSMANVLWVFFL